MISNNHVWAKENQGKPGDPLVQPGVLDGGDPSKDVVATLYDFIAIDFAPTAYNKVDLAVATPFDVSLFYMAIPVIGGVTKARDPQLNEPVAKSGRTTGYTEGYVFDTSATLKVTYSTGEANFTDVVIIKDANIQPGDSGSPVVAKQDKAFLGLVFAGNDTGDIGVVCKQSNIVSALSQKWGRNVAILVANSPDPFRLQTIIKPVYVSPPALQAVEASIFLLLVSIVPLTWEQVFSIEKSKKFV